MVPRSSTDDSARRRRLGRHAARGALHARPGEAGVLARPAPAGAHRGADRGRRPDPDRRHPAELTQPSVVGPSPAIGWGGPRKRGPAPVTTSPTAFTRARTSRAWSVRVIAP